MRKKYQLKKYQNIRFNEKQINKDWLIKVIRKNFSIKKFS